MRHRVDASVAYAEPRCKTNFSFLQGASHPDELIGRAAERGLAALAITDVNTLAGVVRAHVAAKKIGLKLVIGAEITPVDGPAILLYASDIKAYGRLSQLITRGRRAAPKGECFLTRQDVADHAAGLQAAVVAAPPFSDDIFEQFAFNRDVFADRCYLAASLHRGPNDERDLAHWIDGARRARLPLIATNDVHYHVPARRPLQDVLTAIQHGIPVSELGALRFANGERHLKSPAEMHELFAAYPAALDHGLELAERCHFSLDELRYEYPEDLCPAGYTPTRYLAELTWAGARERYPAGLPEKIRDLIQKELALIEELRYEAYFLTVWDLVRFARSRDILCQGRGSAANSAVCYCIGVTAVDPERTELLFERFISRERDEPPDIDVDFEHERREEVFQYIYEKYGRDRAGIVAEVITYRPRSAVRDVGKALGISLDGVDRLAKALDWHAETFDLAERAREAGLDANTPGTVQLVHLAGALLGFPRHLSQHVGGFVITRGPLADLVPVENAAMPDRTVIEWNKDDLDALGLLKVDCLALGMLTAIHKCFQVVSQHHAVDWTLATIPAEDPEVYEMICRADTIGVFQIESRAQMTMLPRLQPRCFYHLVVEIAIVRPGPIQGGMIHPYLRRQNGDEVPTYPNAEIEKVLSKTLGVPLFQEQVMRLAVVAAGFTPGEADELRRAMGTWGKDGSVDRFRAKLRAGMRARGIPDDYAAVIYEQIKGFGQYGFPESHAASFALLAYASAWLKRYYPAAFTAALLNSQPMGFYEPSQLVRDAEAHGVVVRPVDVNISEWDCTLEPPDLRLGFRLVKGLAEKAARVIIAARQDGPFRSVADLARRTGVGQPLLARLAAADAFGSLGLGRRTALWQVLSAGDELPLFAGFEDETPVPSLPEMPLKDEVIADYESMGVSLKAHPMGLIRPTLDTLEVVTAAALADLPNRKPVRVAGLALVRQRPPTANGVVFMTLEDETGLINLIIRPSVWERFRHTRTAAALLITGRIERAGRVIHVSPTRLDNLSRLIQGIASRSRDFR